MPRATLQEHARTVPHDGPAPDPLAGQAPGSRPPARSPRAGRTLAKHAPPRPEVGPDSWAPGVDGPEPLWAVVFTTASGSTALLTVCTEHKRRYESALSALGLPALEARRLGHQPGASCRNCRGFRQQRQAGVR